MTTRILAFAEDRTDTREIVHHRARATGPDAKPLTMLIANISSRGLMARCETNYALGDRLSVSLPVVGATAAIIRWSLGGRIGCEFEKPIGPAEYYEVLGAMTRS